MWINAFLALSLIAPLPKDRIPDPLEVQIKAESDRMRKRMAELSARGDGLYNFRADEWLWIHEGKVTVGGKECHAK